ncbi:MAG: transcription-repair coupling factor [Lachnospiraceae bacterium]|nr:transcription-repair coupling factor [Lachnospiraceae bacterium]
MQALFSPLHELTQFDEMQRFLGKSQGILSLSGCIDAQKWHMAYALCGDTRVKIIITYSELEARKVCEQVRFYDRNACLYPARDLIFYQADVHSNEQAGERIRVLKRLLQKQAVTVVTTFDALMTPQIPLKIYEESIIEIRREQTVDLAQLSKRLVSLGYEKCAQAQEPGQFAVRGDIVDVFDLTGENPVRIELWGDEVESLRSYDAETQRSMEELRNVRIFPASEMILSEERLQRGMKRIKEEAAAQEQLFRQKFQTEEAHRIHTQVKELEEALFSWFSMVNLDSYLHYFYDDTESLLDYIESDRSVIMVEEPARIEEHVRAVELEFQESMSARLEKGYLLPGQTKLMTPAKETAAALTKRHVLALSTLPAQSELFVPQVQYEVPCKPVSSYNKSFETLIRDLTRYKKNRSRVVFLSPSRTRARRLAENIREYELPAVFTDDPYREPVPGEVLCLQGSVAHGFEYPSIGFAVIADTDIFGAEKTAGKKKKNSASNPIRDFAELHVGDYVVHEMYGLARYEDIEKVVVDHVAKDYLKLAYRDGGYIYLPATGLYLLQKYSSADGKEPKLTKLGTKEWSKTRQKVKAAVDAVARDLVELYAHRQRMTGYVYGPDTVWQKEFEELFPYEETEDQLTAIEAVKKDMESPKIMDRLICGDVGYGKTEIAIRAAFKAVQEGKQVVYLVPTTILAEQHYQTFLRRMKDYPVTVELLCRFRTPAEQKQTLENLRKGLADIVIGTHRVLSKDVEFKDLGLLIIDEEQRFGVAAKEKIKKLKESVDVLTLTATPIPRTLHMSLIGVRDMSLLEEAPQDRMPIQTYVMEYNEEMVREAIVRELARGGQVFYVYNRVNDIDMVAAKVSSLVPEATVAFAHGQMAEHQLERIMYEFVSGRIDVLVSTTIIETGMDISNANTMIIHDADNLGLAQLYQLRGRVGRSSRTAYAFMMYHRGKLLKETAEKRLEAIREFTDLGSGFKIAMRDLEIRGAGNILGRSQSGHLEAVGYDLYCKMLNQAVSAAKGEPVPEELNTTVDLSADAFIPEEYIVNEGQKLDIYKRIAGVESADEKEDMLQELKDRFSTVPEPVDHLLRINILRVRGQKMRMTEIKNTGNRLQFVLRPDAKVDSDKIPAFIRSLRGSMTFTPMGTPTFTYRSQLTGVVEKDARILLADAEMILDKMEKELYTMT